MSSRVAKPGTGGTDPGLNVILTGFMGAGKSTVGRLLAEALGYRFVDTDDLIASREGRSIAEIFATDGEEAFRTLEAAVALELAGQSGLVVATGGRLMLAPENAAALERNGRVFCLVASPRALAARLADEVAMRPLLSGPDPAARIATLLNERAAGYGRFEQIDTEGKQPAAVVRELLGKLGTVSSEVDRGRRAV